MVMVHIIRTARQQPSLRRIGGDYRRYVAERTDERWPGASPDWRAMGTAVLACVMRSDWVAECPDCPGSLVVEPDEPYFCPDCQNVLNGGRARPVLWPEERREIEAVLLARPVFINRNYLPQRGETLATLLRENAAHGDPYGLPAATVMRILSANGGTK